MNTTRNRRGSRAAAVTLLAALAVGTIGATQAQAVAGFNFSVRTGGADRVDTAVATSVKLYPKGGQDDVVLVNRDAIVDGLSASYLAGLKNAPILLTNKDAVPAATAAEIKRLGAKNVWLVGGTTVISATQEKALGAVVSGDVKRYSGDDRYGTAAAVAVAGPYQPERVYIASGTSLADAVVVSPVAWANNYPVLLTQAGSAPKATTDALAKLGTANRTVVGGTTVISDPTAKALGSTGRLGGADRQGTAVLVANDAVDTANFTHANVALVGGADSNAVDALASAALAGAHGTPLLYTQNKDAISGTSANYLKANRLELNSESLGIVLGGQDAVTDKAVAQAVAAAQ